MKNILNKPDGNFTLLGHLMGMCMIASLILIYYGLVYFIAKVIEWL